MKDFEWILFSVDPATIAECCAAGVHGIIVDWENRGKRERQSGFDTQINTQTVEDLRRARLATPPDRRLFCRINGWNANSPREIDEAIDNGADEIFLPMVRTPQQVEWTLRWIDNRVPLGILIETRDAVECASELASLRLSRIYVGLNDLSIDYGNSSLFRALYDGTVDRIRERIPDGMPFGIAGMTMPELGSPLPARLLACEIARLGARFTFLRRSFLRDIKGRDVKQEVPRMLAAIEAARSRGHEQIAADHEEFAAAAQSTEKVLFVANRRWLIAAASVAAVVFSISGIITGDHTPRWQQDEAWETRVLQRVLTGEVLYRDVFYGTGPLAIYLLQLWAKLLNGGLAEPWLLRLQNFGAYLGQIAILAWVVAKHVRPHPAITASVTLASFVWLRPFPNSTYNNLAFLFMAATLAAAFERRWLWCGVAAGLAFCSKQNVGGFAFLFALPFAWADGGLPAIARLCTGFAATLASCLTALWMQGALPGFVEFGFLAKGNYVRQGTLWPEWRALRPSVSGQWLQSCSLLAIPFSVAAPVLFRRDPVGLRLGVFALASALATGPRFDIAHTLMGLPAALCAFAYASEFWKLRRYTVPAIVSAALVLAWFHYGVPIRAAISGEAKEGTLLGPQYRGLYLQNDQLEQMKRLTQGIPKNREIAFVISSRASLIYATTGIHNPTRYDYPASTSMGLHGQQDVIDHLERHRDACVWQEDDPSMPLHPLQLEAYVRTSLTVVTATEGGAMYCRAQWSPRE